MNQHMPGQHQANFQNQPLQQPQNGGQQRQAANGPQKVTQEQQKYQTPVGEFVPPKLVLFTLEKPRNVEGWDDVEPEKQFIATQDLQNELAKFKRNQNSVKRALDEISSPSCRRLINDLVRDETEKLWENNKSVQYTIAAILNKSRWLDERKQRQELKRVQVILEIESSGFPDTRSQRPAVGGFGNVQGGQDMNMNMNKPKQQAGMGNPQGPNMQQQQQQPRNVQQPGNHMGQSQHLDPRPLPPHGAGQMHGGGGGAPPPPPPPPGGGGHHGAHAPPPPPGGHGGHPQGHHPHGGIMPGAFPGAMPMHGMRQGQPPIQVIDPRHMHNGKSKPKGRRNDFSSESSDDWESESGSSGSEPIRVRNVEHGDYGLVGKKEGRGRGKHSKTSKKSRRHRSQSQGISRSRSHSRPAHRSSRRRRDSDLIDSRGKHSTSSSEASSPKLPPIHIHMPAGNTSSGDERGHRKRHERRDSLHELPGLSYSKHKHNRKTSSHPMARGGSKDSRDSKQSWDRFSESSYATTSSVNTPEDSLFDVQRRPRLHRHSTSYSRPNHGSHTPPRTYSTYDDLNRREHARDVRADDYPYSTSPPRGRDPYHAQPTFNSRPLPHRRATVQGHLHNPFDTENVHRRNTEQSYNYPADMHQAGIYPLPRQLRYSPETSPARHDRTKMDELAGALLDHIKQDNQRAPLRRRHTDFRGVGEEEWDGEMRGQSGRGGVYGGGYRY